MAAIEQLLADLPAVRDQLAKLVAAGRTRRVDLVGIGPILAARILGEVGEAGRFPAADHFAAANGTTLSRPPRSCGHGSGGHRGWPTPPVRSARLYYSNIERRQAFRRRLRFYNHRRSHTSLDGLTPMAFLVNNVHWNTAGAAVMSSAPHAAPNQPSGPGPCAPPTAAT
jgi:hypothetical protein